MYMYMHMIIYNVNCWCLAKSIAWVELRYKIVSIKLWLDFLVKVITRYILRKVMRIFLCQLDHAFY